MVLDQSIHWVAMVEVVKRSGVMEDGLELSRRDGRMRGRGRREMWLSLSLVKDGRGEDGGKDKVVKR